MLGIRIIIVMLNSLARKIFVHHGQDSKQIWSQTESAHEEAARQKLSQSLRLIGYAYATQPMPALRSPTLEASMCTSGGFRHIGIVLQDGF